METIKNFFRGRLERGIYFLQLLLLSIISLAIFLPQVLISHHIDVSFMTTFGILNNIIRLILFIYGLRILILRLHDLGKPWWWAIGSYIPVLNFILIIYTLFWGSDDQNKYGPKPKQKKWVKRWLIIGLSFIVIVIVVAFVAGFMSTFNPAAQIQKAQYTSPFTIVGLSMSPKYVDGQQWVADITSYKSHNPQRGDVVLFKIQIPQITGNSNMKRVVGLPEEKIMLENGLVYINGQILDESSYLVQGMTTYGEQFLADGTQYTIPSGSYFLLGDNRSHSYDSRAFGVITSQAIIGKVISCYKGCTTQ